MAKYKMREQFVYFIYTGEFTKIGLSIRPKKRIMDIVGGLPFKHIYFFAYKVDNMVYVESYLHNMFYRERTNGEWFKLTTDQIIYAQKYLLEYENAKLVFHVERYSKKRRRFNWMHS